MGPEAPCCYCCPTTGATCASFSVNLGSPVGQPVPLLPAISNYAYGKKRREKKKKRFVYTVGTGQKERKGSPMRRFSTVPRRHVINDEINASLYGEKRRSPPPRQNTRTEHHRSRQLSSPRVKHLCRLDTRPRGRGTLTKKKKKKKWLERV